MSEGCVSYEDLVSDWQTNAFQMICGPGAMKPLHGTWSLVMPRCHGKTRLLKRIAFCCAATHPLFVVTTSVRSWNAEWPGVVRYIHGNAITESAFYCIDDADHCDPAAVCALLAAAAEGRCRVIQTMVAGGTLHYNTSCLVFRPQ